MRLWILQKRCPRVQEGWSGRAGRLLRVLVVVIAASVAVPAGQAADLSPVERSETPVFTRPSFLGDVAYTPGRGLRIGDTGLTLGGYNDITLTRDEGKRAELELDDLSLFVIVDPLPRVHVFSEIEYEDVVRLDDHGNVVSPDESLTVERLYGDLAITDAVNVRTGIFLTPVGRWNQIHAAPLVWTTSRPLVTEKPFDPDLTGVMLFGSIFPRQTTLTYYLYDQFEEPIEGDPEFDPADHSVGGRLELEPTASWSVGASYLAARRHGEWRHLGGTDFQWNFPHGELLSEAVIADGAGRGFEWGGYVQAAFGVTERLTLVDRYEHYAAPGATPSVNLVSIGAAFRLFPTVVFKLEYLIADRSTPDAAPGFKASIATLF